LQLCEEGKGWNDQKVSTVWEKKHLMCTLTLPQKRVSGCDGGPSGE
jgi:hypothetical protein